MTTPPAPRRTTRPRSRIALAVLLIATLLGTLACGTAPQPAAVAATTAECPARLAGITTCFTGLDANGAYYTLAVPHRWNHSLVVHAHGGPDPSYDASGPTEDLERWAVMVEQGYAWAASSYRRGGYGVRMAAEDTENVRRIFVDRVGRPDRTYLHGQSFGGNVAAKLAETRGRETDAYDGVLLTNGLLGGGSHGYDHRVDLRVVYQYFCRNLPRPDEAQYPLWQGLPPGSDLTTDDVEARVQECTGLGSEPAARTPQQQWNLDQILAVTRLPEESLDTSMLYATFLFQDLVAKRLGGRNPFTNADARYSGSDDDTALNAGVERFEADPVALRDLSYDSDLTGQVSLPVLSLHAIHDPSVFVEHESAYRDTLRAAGRDEHLVQTFTTENEHSGLSDSEYAASITALDAWARSGEKPAPDTVAAGCGTFDRTYRTGCFYDPRFRPGQLPTRITPRDGDLSWPLMTAAREREWSRVDGIGIAP